ncbi:MAG: hypothetical protein GY725_02780 [bacterium]|nr:hypothetical protein [bacterium]
MIPIVLKDEIPRQLAYPIGEGYLSSQLLGDAEEEDFGLFYLFTSGIQLDYYDPLTSRESVYPVLALDRNPPPLVGHAQARLGEAQRRRAELAGLVHASHDGKCKKARVEEAKAIAESTFKVSLVIFPVKARIRQRVTDAIEDNGMAPIRNWLNAALEGQENQKPLVLLFDEITCKLTATFAKQTGPRRLYT